MDDLCPTSERPSRSTLAIILAGHARIAHEGDGITESHFSQVEPPRYAKAALKLYHSLVQGAQEKLGGLNRVNESKRGELLGEPIEKARRCLRARIKSYAEW
jgi:hypothetical protein